MNEQTVTCPLCRRPYKVYSMYAGDQSACSKCRSLAEDGKGVDFIWPVCWPKGNK